MSYRGGYRTGYRGFTATGNTGGGGARPAWATRWGAALDGRAAAPATIVMLGDSVTEGQSSTAVVERWPNKAAASLRAAYPTPGVVGGSGYWASRYYVYNPATWGAPHPLPASVTGTVSYPTDRGNLGYRTAQLNAGASWTASVTGSSVDVHYEAGGGSFTVQVDGGGATAAQSATSAGRYRVTFGTTGAHTVRINAVSTFRLSGIMVYNGDETKGLRFYEAGHSGFTTANHLADVANVMTELDRVAPDLVTVFLGLNEYPNTTPAVFQANLTSLMTQVQGRAKVPSILIIASYTPGWSGATVAGWAPYVAAMQAVATAKGCGLLDLSAVMPQATTSGTGFYNADALHPNNSGMTEVARLVTAKLSV